MGYREQLEEMLQNKKEILEQVKSEREEKQEKIDDAVMNYRRTLEEEFHLEYERLEGELNGSIRTIETLLKNIDKIEEEVLT